MITNLIALSLAATVAGANAQPANPTAAANAQPESTKYCAETAATGSRILKTVCLTKKEWALQGVDIEAEAKRK